VSFCAAAGCCVDAAGVVGVGILTVEGCVTELCTTGAGACAGGVCTVGAWGDFVCTDVGFFAAGGVMGATVTAGGVMAFVLGAVVDAVSVFAGAGTGIGADAGGVSEVAGADVDEGTVVTAGDGFTCICTT
jgi:hypothetical protein